MTHIDKMSILNKVIVRRMSNCQLNVKNVLTTPIEPAVHTEKCYCIFFWIILVYLKKCP